MGVPRVCILTLLLGALPVDAAEIDRAFARLYDFDFRGAHAQLDGYIAAHPDEPLPYAVRASAYLFSELDRLGILESEFLVSDKRIIEKKKLKPDAAIRERLFRAIEDAESRARRTLATRPYDHDALFTFCITQGVVTDYMALVEKRQLGSLAPARRSNDYAQRLLALDPHFYDAYLTAGLSEYLLGSLPFFVRWFVRFDNIKGSKGQAVENLQLVAREGHYLGPFAKILLCIIYLREKKPRETIRLLEELAREHPGNPLIRKELAKISTHFGGAL